MCGGRGTRLGGETEKPLVGVGDSPMVDRVCAALAGSRLDRVYCAVSPHTPATRAHLAELADVTVVETPGDGYVADLGVALDRVGTPVVTTASDLPLLTPATVDTALDARDEDGGSLTVCVPVDLKRELGVSVDTTTDHGGRQVAPTGLNVVDDDEGATVVVDDRRLAVNVNRPCDLQIAHHLLSRGTLATQD
jgi:adenosylcobinamide-phosphate guanylyltransferase